MSRRREDLVGGPRLDERARVHHVHPLAHSRDDPQVVGDHHQCRPMLTDERAQELEDLRLDRHVQGGRRLVGDQQFGSQASAIAIIARCLMPPEN